MEIISAGAGSGKTYTLTQRLVKKLTEGVRPSGIIATTFTKKAASELQDRVRVRLLEEGHAEAANELGNAYIGTVHSIGARLLQRFAFEAGVSPLVEIIAEEDTQTMFNESLAQVLDDERIEQFEALCDRLGLHKTKGKEKEEYDWRKSIRSLTDVARANNFSITDLEKSKQNSWASFQKFLPEAEKTDAQTWNNRLIAHLEQCTEALKNNDTDSTKTTKDAVLVLQQLLFRIREQGLLFWHDWVKISKVKVGAKSRDLAEELIEFSKKHLKHAGFQGDIQGFINLIFETAKDALTEFEEYKTKRGLIDYTDMETLVCRLLKMPHVREVLREEVDLLMVDEFQDTSPIQLDMFLQLSRLAKHSIWVGDPKQSIYGFRGADPALMQAVIAHNGGVKEENILKDSYRSRADIVNAVNAIFVKGFPDLPPNQVVLNPKRTKKTDDSEAGLALINWHFKNFEDSGKAPANPWLENCVATEIQVMLERGIKVKPKDAKNWQPVRAGDIAVLCRSNENCAKMATALHQAGIKAAISRTGLLQTKEARLLLACLRYILHPSDALSIAELRILAAGESLETVANDRLDFLHQKKSDETLTNWAQENSFLKKLYAIRTKTADLSASEIVNLLLDELDLRRIAVSYGNPPQRLDNLDRLRHYAFEYEENCTRRHAAASLGGFLLWLDALAKAQKDTQGSGESPVAVRVLTYHKSKGLEYPVTICMQLEQNLKENIWGINLVPEKEEVDLDDILGNRWLRFWVNPYGDLSKNTELVETIEQSPEYEKSLMQARAEEARLLYVGLTRARDYLIFPSSVKPTKWLNRVFSNGNEDTPTLDPNSPETPFYIDGDCLLMQNEIIYREKAFPHSEIQEKWVLFHAAAHGRTEFEPLYIDGFTDKTGLKTTLSETVKWGETLFVGSNPELQIPLFKAVCALFYGDNLKFAPEIREKLGKHQHQLAFLQNAFKPSELLAQSEAFLLFLKKEFEIKKLQRRLPIRVEMGQKLLEANIDLVLENDAEVVLIVFADAGEYQKRWKSALSNHANLCEWLRFGYQNIYKNDGRILRTWVVFPVEGLGVEVS